MAKHLVQSQRDEIQILLEKWYKHRPIARVLWVSHKTIDHEIAVNSTNRVYNAKKAWHKAYARSLNKKKQMKKIRQYDDLEQYIRLKLQEDRSPEEITNSWNESHSVTISTPTIYKYIDSKYGYGLHEHLYTQRPKRRKRRQTQKKEIIKNKVMIDKRPSYIWEKIEFWHYEVDLIMWKKTGKACLLVLIEMQTRFKIVYWLPDKTALQVEIKLLEAIKKYGIKTMTFDNGTEFAWHINLWILTFFCYAHSPRQKPQVERGKRNIRWYYPKWTDFTNIHQKEIDIIMEKINNRPMKCLNYVSPNTLFIQKLLFFLATLGV